MKKSNSFLILIIILIAIIALLFKNFPTAMNDDQNKMALASSVLMLVLLFSRVTIDHLKWGIFLRQVVGWIVILLLILTGYSYQGEIKEFGNRITATVIPGYGQGNGDGSVTFYAEQNGHFTITGLINNETRIKFLFDTGASMISLTAEDAQNIGIDINSLNYNFPLSTANGISYGARIRLASITVGPIMLTEVDAVVSKEGSSDISLLGMSFLGRLKQFIIKGNSLTLAN